MSKAAYELHCQLCPPQIYKRPNNLGYLTLSRLFRFALAAVLVAIISRLLKPTFISRDYPNIFRFMSNTTVANTLFPIHPQVKLIPRPSESRGGGNHGWLKTFHTFSFATFVGLILSCNSYSISTSRYQDSAFERWRDLRVMNEDRVEPMTGFGTHGHREFEIFSYVVNGELEQCVACLDFLNRNDIYDVVRTLWGIRKS